MALVVPLSDVYSIVGGSGLHIARYIFEHGAILFT
jgi:hypothetical protein